MSVILTEYMATKNIEINIKTESGYDVLYPLTTPQQAGSLPISGGILTGPLMLNREPQESMEAVNKNYVDNNYGEIELLKEIDLGTPTRTGALYGVATLILEENEIDFNFLYLFEVTTSVDCSAYSNNDTGYFYIQIGKNEQSNNNWQLQSIRVTSTEEQTIIKTNLRPAFFTEDITNGVVTYNISWFSPNAYLIDNINKCVWSYVYMTSDFTMNKMNECKLKIYRHRQFNSDL